MPITSKTKIDEWFRNKRRAKFPTGVNYLDAAEQLHIDLRTLHRWRKSGIPAHRAEDYQRVTGINVRRICIRYKYQEIE